MLIRCMHRQTIIPCCNVIKSCGLVPVIRGSSNIVCAHWYSRRLMLVNFILLIIYVVVDSALVLKEYIYGNEYVLQLKELTILTSNNCPSTFLINLIKKRLVKPNYINKFNFLVPHKKKTHSN